MLFLCHSNFGLDKGDSSNELSTHVQLRVRSTGSDINADVTLNPETHS